MKNLHGRRLARAVPVLALAFALTLPVGALAQDLVPVGRAVGIEAETDGLLVASLSKVQTESGEAAPAAGHPAMRPMDLGIWSAQGEKMPRKVQRMAVGWLVLAARHHLMEAWNAQTMAEAAGPTAPAAGRTCNI